MVIFMENSETYIIQNEAVLGAVPVQVVGDNKSRHSVILTNNSDTTINFSTLGRVGVGVGVELAPGQTVTITQQYDGDFARIQLYGVAGAEDSKVTVYQVIAYGRSA